MNDLKEKQPKEEKQEILVSKKNREDNYYEKLYRQYRTKITVEYDDEYDDLVDYEKKPFIFDEEESSNSDLDSEEEKLHLVKSESNTSRDRAHLGEKKQPFNNKYNRKGKVNYIPVKQQEAQRIVQKEKAKREYYEKEEAKREHYEKREEVKKKTEKPVYREKGKKEYEDEECFQECKVKIADIKQEEEKKQFKKGENYGKNHEKNKKKNTKWV